MNSPIPALSAGHYFSTFEAPHPINAVAANLTGAASMLRGTDPVGYGNGILQQWGILPNGEPAAAAEPDQPAGLFSLGPTTVNWLSYALVGLVAVALIVLGASLLATEAKGAA